MVLDVARHLGVEHLEPGFPIGPDELDGTAAAQGVTVGAGDIVLVHTGHVGWKLGLPAGSADAANRSEPGISTRAIPWLHDHDVAMIATDTAACSVVPAEPGDEFLTWHVAALRDLGLLVGELFDLDELAADCAARRAPTQGSSSRRRCRSWARAAHRSTRCSSSSEQHAGPAR